LITVGVFWYANRPEREQTVTDLTYLKGSILILGGIYGLLLARGVLPVNPKDPERDHP